MKWFLIYNCQVLSFQKSCRVMYKFSNLLKLLNFSNNSVIMHFFEKNVILYYYLLYFSLCILFIRPYIKYYLSYSIFSGKKITLLSLHFKASALHPSIKWYFFIEIVFLIWGTLIIKLQLRLATSAQPPHFSVISL